MTGSSARYVLRRTLTPWNAEELVDELARFCVANHVEEVAAVVDGEEFTHNLPTLGWLDGYLPVLRMAKERLSAEGVVFSLNPWVTVVHCDRGRDIRLTLPDVVRYTGHDGTVCTGCACPLSPAWRDLTRELWQQYASLEPAVIWVEDDIRLINHQPVEYGCFCQLHLEALEQRVGRAVSREEIVGALVAPGAPHPLRAEWLDLNRDLVRETGRFFEQIVHGVSPETRLGLMCSMPSDHAIEGRDWGQLLKAVSGRLRPLARPCMMNYSESSLRGLYDSELMLRQTRRCLGPDVEVQTEIENIPFTAYSKSARFLFLQMALSFVCGADGVTLNLFDHVGSPMSLSPEIAETLAGRKPVLDALAESCQGGKQSGVQLLHEPAASYHVHLAPNADYRDLAPGGEAWAKVLSPLGISYTYEAGPVVALSGQVARALGRDGLMALLAGGLLLDLTALRCLHDLGLSDHTGVSIEREFRKYDEPVAAEEFYNSDFGGADRKYLTLTLPHLGGNALMARLQLAPGAVGVSRMVNPDTEPVHPFVTVFENTLGGRVCVFPLDLREALGPAFLNPFRRQQIVEVCHWLSHDLVPLVVSGGAYPLPFRIDQKEFIVVGSFNLSLDPWPIVSFALPRETPRIARVEWLGEEGRWIGGQSLVWSQSVDGSMRIECGTGMDAAGILALRLRFGAP